MESPNSQGSKCALVVIVAASCTVWTYGATLEPSELAAIETAFEEAKLFVRQGQYASAAAAFEAVAAANAGTRKGQRAAVEAGINYDRADQVEKALEQFDLAVSRATPSPLSEAALYEKAAMCQRRGRVKEAIQAIDYLRLGFPYSTRLFDALDILAHVHKLTPEQLQALKGLEQQALESLREVNRLMGGDQYEAALQLAEEIKTKFSQSGAALAAAMAEGQILCKLGQFGKACEVMLPLLDRLDAAAPRSEMAQEGRSLVGRAILDYAEGVYEHELRRRSAESPATWKAVREYVERVEFMGHDYRQLARARVMLVALDLVEGDPAKAERRVGIFLKSYGGLKKLRRFPVEVMHFHLLAAETFRVQGKHDRAFALSEKIKQMYGQLPPEDQRGVRDSYRQACYLSFHLLCLMQADRAAIEAAAQEVLNRFPESRQAAQVKRQLGASFSAKSTP